MRELDEARERLPLACFGAALLLCYVGVFEGDLRADLRLDFEFFVEVEDLSDASGGDASVPIYHAYNHHYFSWLTGNGSKIVDLDQPTRWPNPTRTSIVEETPHKGGFPTSIVFKEIPGGEFRKSYHGYPQYKNQGNAQLLASPTEFVMTPMQIDTWNRDKMDISGPSFAYSLPVHSFHTRRDRVASLTTCRLHGAAIQRASPLGPGRALTLPCGWNNAGMEGQTLAEANEDIADQVVLWDSENLNPEMAESISRLWADPGVQQIFERRAEFQIGDNAHYFLADVRRIGAHDYTPTTADALSARVRTSGVVSKNFDIKGAPHAVYDVGGQRSERRNWLPRSVGRASVSQSVSFRERANKRACQ